MTFVLLFWVLVLCTCGFAARYGGWEGRWFAAVYLAQCAFMVLAWLTDWTWSRTNWPTVAVDTFLLVAFYILARTTRRFWPIWVFGFHLITMSAHLATLISQSIPFRAYYSLATMWAIPKLLVVIFGISLDLRAGLRPPVRPTGQPGGHSRLVPLLRAGRRHKVAANKP